MEKGTVEDYVSRALKSIETGGRSAYGRGIGVALPKVTVHLDKNGNIASNPKEAVVVIEAPFVWTIS